MGCNRQCCGRFVFWVGIVLMVLGLASGLYGYFGVNIEETFKLGTYTVPSFTALFGIAAIIVGLFTVVTGIFGALAGHFKYPCYTLPFQILVIIMSLLMLIVAGLAVLGSSGHEQALEAICRPPNGAPISVAGESYTNLDQYMKVMYGGSIDFYMCTPVCPCVDTNQKAYKEKTSTKGGKKGFEYTPGKFRVFDMNSISKSQRDALVAFDINSFDAAQQGALKDQENYDPNFPVLWNMLDDKITVFPLYWVPVSDKFAYNSFSQCWDDETRGLKKFLRAKSSEDQINKIDAALQFFQILEKKYNCSGACAIPLFGIGRLLTDGPVTEDCIDGLLDQLDTLLAPGIVCLLTFFVLISSCIGGFWLCCGKGQDQEDIMHKDNMEGGDVAVVHL